MPFFAPLLMVLLVAATLAGMAVTTFSWTQQRTGKLHREINADIEQTLRQHDLRKLELAATEQQLPPRTNGAAARTDDDKAKKAQMNSIRKRASGQRRERFVPPDFARLPLAIARGAFGFPR